MPYDVRLNSEPKSRSRRFQGPLGGETKPIGGLQGFNGGSGSWLPGGGGQGQTPHPPRNLPTRHRHPRAKARRTQPRPPFQPPEAPHSLPRQPLISPGTLFKKTALTVSTKHPKASQTLTVAGCLAPPSTCFVVPIPEAGQVNPPRGPAALLD